MPIADVHPAMKQAYPPQGPRRDFHLLDTGGVVKHRPNGHGYGIRVCNSLFLQCGRELERESRWVILRLCHSCHSASYP